MSRELRNPAPARPMDGVLSDMRALVGATRRLVGAVAGEVTRQARVSGGAPEREHGDEPRDRVRGWETQDDLHLPDPEDIESIDDTDDTEDIEETEEMAPSGRLHGIWIAGATFVPTFLTIVLGATYLAGPPMGARVLTDLDGGPRPVVAVRAPQKAPLAVQGQAEGPAASSTVPNVETVGGAESSARMPSPPTKEAITWVRGAAFPDRDSAERLAAGIEQQGYPSKIGREGTSATAWVVWIAKQPRGRAPSERRE